MHPIRYIYFICCCSPSASKFNMSCLQPHPLVGVLKKISTLSLNALGLKLHSYICISSLIDLSICICFYTFFVWTWALNIFFGLKSAVMDCLYYFVDVSPLCSVFHIVQIKTAIESSRAFSWHTLEIFMGSHSRSDFMAAEGGEGRGRVGGQSGFAVRGEISQPYFIVHPFFLRENQITRLD